MADLNKEENLIREENGYMDDNLNGPQCRLNEELNMSGESVMRGSVQENDEENNVSNGPVANQDIQIIYSNQTKLQKNITELSQATAGEINEIKRKLEGLLTKMGEPRTETNNDQMPSSRPDAPVLMDRNAREGQLGQGQYSNQHGNHTQAPGQMAMAARAVQPTESQSRTMSGTSPAAPTLLDGEAREVLPRPRE